MTTAEKTDLFKDWVQPEIKEDSYITGLKINNSLWPHENVNYFDFSVWDFWTRQKVCKKYRLEIWGFRAI